MVKQKAVKLSAAELLAAILDLRTTLMKKGEATELFAQERASGSVEGIVGNVMQSFGGQALYKTAEEKAAHLLYFMVKTIHFLTETSVPGLLLCLVLRKAKIRGARNINPASLTALTLLVAESDPARKEQMTALITQMLV